MISTLKNQVESVGACLKERELENSKLIEALESCKAEVVSLKGKLVESSKSSASSLAELQKCKNLFEKEKAELSGSIATLQETVSGLQVQADGFKLLESKFVDPVTQSKHVCPVIQTNGVIRSLPEIVDIWLKEPDLGQSNAFRMFQCPVLKNFSMVAPFQVVETVMSLASTVGVNSVPPVLFQFKQTDDSWLEFPLHEQLELIARLCTVYSQRKNEARPPEQRNVTVVGMSFVLLMRAVVHGKGHQFECYGVNNRGGNRVDIKIVFQQGWSHPFEDMDFAQSV